MGRVEAPRRSGSILASFFTGFFFIWVITAIISLALTVAGLYVAYHFILKYW
jgi:hypothetical protein